MNPEKRLQPWRLLAIGQRVTSACKYKRGAAGTVTERLDDRMDGMARYGVRLDCDGGKHTADFCRHELKPIRTAGRRLQKVKVQ